MWSRHFKRNPEQIWIVLSHESTLYKWGNLFEKNPFFNNLYNWSMTTSKRSTIYRPFFYVRPRHVQMNSQEANDSQLTWQQQPYSFCWLFSNCQLDWAGRLELGNALIKHLPHKLHLWGTGFECLDEEAKKNTINHGPFPGRWYDLYEPHQSKIRYCKFYLAFENSICSDYITEKFMNSLEAGAVPIVNGWQASYDERIPGSFIHVSEFESVSQLADYLKYLLNNKTAYSEYHTWRRKYTLERVELQPVCELCRKLQDFKVNAPKSKAISIIFNLETLNPLLENCSNPFSIDKDGLISRKSLKLKKLPNFVF